MAKLKSYKDNQKVLAKESKKSGVACDEKKCKGEMMIWQPEINHPELTLKRASCGKCGWRGWV